MARIQALCSRKRLLWWASCLAGRRRQMKATTGKFVDATPFSNRESFHGVFINSLRRGTRFLIAVAKKSSFCSCGCQGWCSLACLQWMLIWSFRALEQGYWPSERHDRKAWTPGDSWRSGSDPNTQSLGYLFRSDHLVIYFT